MTREYSVFRKALLFFACVLLGATLISCSKQNEKPAKTILKAAISPSIPPFMFVENNQLVGMDYEIFKGFCDSRGYECQTE
jgi:polar amino acid transport system substrate-binding protein